MPVFHVEHARRWPRLSDRVAIDHTFRMDATVASPYGITGYALPRSRLLRTGAPKACHRTRPRAGGLPHGPTKRHMRNAVRRGPGCCPASSAEVQHACDGRAAVTKVDPCGGTRMRARCVLGPTSHGLACRQTIEPGAAEPRSARPRTSILSPHSPHSQGAWWAADTNTARWIGAAGNTIAAAGLDRRGDSILIMVTVTT